MKKSGFSPLKGAFFIFAGVLALAIPLVRDFHVESALLVAVVGCFWAALRGCYSRRIFIQDDLKPAFIILGYGYSFGLPLFLYAVATGCFSLNGLGFWLLYPIPSVLLGYALGRFLQMLKLPFRRIIAVAILLIVSIGVPAFEFFHYPQVYFFNQVWGGWPGPIYDETVKVSWSLVSFRVLTIAWIALLWWTPAVHKSIKAKVIVALCGLLLMAGYSRLPKMGIISPRSYLQKQLGGKKETPHFILYYDKKHYSKDEINFIAQKHEFYFNQITDTLHLGNAGFSSKIESYLYANPWQKKALVGAKFTSYVPIWLAQDQLHIAKQQIPQSLKHELVHVLAKRFGNSLFNGSWSVGLVEGLAVALSGNESPVSTINQIVVSEKPYPSAHEMKDAFSVWGFYKGRSAVNYTQSGSFVQYLLQNYPVGELKKAYQTGNIANAYASSWSALVEGWHQALDTVMVDSMDRQVANRLYGFPSLFEQKCPHVQSAFTRQWDQYQYFMTEKDTVRALKHLDNARKEAPGNPLVKNLWAFLNLQSGQEQKVRNKASRADTTVAGLLLYADAFALASKMDVAQHYVAEAARHLKMHPDSLMDEPIQIRQDRTQWNYYREIVYHYKEVSDSTFSFLFPRTQIKAIQQALAHERWDDMKHYAQLIASQKLQSTYFDTYIPMIEWLAFEGDKEDAGKWIHKLKALNLRFRYRERLDETQKWIGFVNAGLKL